MIDWVMRWEGVSFRHAVELLRDGIAPSTGPSPNATGVRPARSTVAKLPSPLGDELGEEPLTRADQKRLEIARRRL